MPYYKLIFEVEGDIYEEIDVVWFVRGFAGGVFVGTIEVAGGD